MEKMIRSWLRENHLSADKVYPFGGMFIVEFANEYELERAILEGAGGIGEGWTIRVYGRTTGLFERL